MKKVLCVCVGNISRSPMMQAVLQQLLDGAFLVESAGLAKELAGRPANHRSVTCMKERGIDLSAHLSRWVGDLDLEQYHWIVCVGRPEADQVRQLIGGDDKRVIVANEQEGGIPDPYEHGMAGYRDCLALLDEVMPKVARQVGQASLQQSHVGPAPRGGTETMTLLLVRHCQSTGGLPESAVTEAGHSAATRLADQLMPLGPDAIYASPYARALSTVSPLAARLTIKINIDDRFCERVRSSEDIADVDGYIHRSFADEHYGAVGGESLRQAADRGLAALADIRRAGHRCTIVASHRTLITSILRSISPRFGFAEWREMRTPDVFSLHFDEDRPIAFERL